MSKSRSRFSPVAFIERLVDERIQQSLSQQANAQPQPNRQTRVRQQVGAQFGVDQRANFEPVTDEVMAKMYQAQSPQDPTTATPFFAPGAPLRPVPGITPPSGPRQFSVPVGVNISSIPRGTEQYLFGDLRNLASLYDGIMLCEQVWLDYVSKLHLVIEPKPELVTPDKALCQQV